MESKKKRIFEIIQIGSRTDGPSCAFDIFIVAVIIVNIFITFFQTFEQSRPYTGVLHTLELATSLIFLIEYVLRILTAEYLYPEEKRWRARVHFVRSFYGVIDLLTFLPYFLPIFFPAGAVAFRMLRVVRIFRLFRVNARYDAFNIITDVLKDKKNQLVSSLFLIVMLMMASSLCMYSLEHEAQPGAFQNAFSGIWWSVSTLLTVGYGDIYPVTVGGRIMAIVVAFLGVGMVAIPTGIISAGFVEQYTRIKVGTYTRHDADFITLDIPKGHPFEDRQLGEVEIPQGLYVAVVMRGRDVLTPYRRVVLEAGDSLLLATTSGRKLESRIEEVTLTQGHAWIGHKIKDLDISRQTFIIMLKRRNRTIEPQGNTLLKENDVVLLYTRLGAAGL